MLERKAVCHCYRVLSLGEKKADAVWSRRVSYELCLLIMQATELHGICSSGIVIALEELRMELLSLEEF